uniref:Venom protein family 2 protein 3 n=1 Tax=Lethocerus distinctifemur TaxID=280095 RepID=A0A2K8JL20_9HEMI|nr:venom protein family 2 protein 3 [Lethocerus distinctifemur]
MGYQKAKTWFLCYLMMSGMVFSMAAEEQIITPSEAEQLTRESLKEYEAEIQDLIDLAPEEPNNDLDDPEKPRLFFLFALLPKLALMLVHVLVKAVPIIVKAVAVVKVKAMAVAATVAAAAKAKAAAVAAATAAKFATPAAIKATVVAGVKTAAKFVAEELVVEGIQMGIETAIDAVKQKSEETPVVDEDKPGVVSNDIFDYYDNDDVCNCTKPTFCSCCVTPKGYSKACLDIRPSSNLWDNDCILKISAFYGGKNIITRRMPVKKPKQKCVEMSAPFDATKMCIAVHGRTMVGNRIIQCLSLHFNQRGVVRCLVQNRKNKLWFRT